MLLKSRPRFRRTLLWGIPVVLLICVAVITLLSLSIELGLRKLCEAATQEFPGDKVDAVMMSVESTQYGYDDRLYSANNRAFWALGQLGDQRALPFLRNLVTGEPCDHETNLCQGEIKEAIHKLEEDQFNLPSFLWRGILDY